MQDQQSTSARANQQEQRFIRAEDSPKPCLLFAEKKAGPTRTVKQAKKNERVDNIYPEIQPLETQMSALSLEGVPNDTKETKNSNPHLQCPVGEDPTITEEYSGVDIEDVDIIPDGNYDVKTARFRLLKKNPNVWISEKITNEVYDRMLSSGKLFVHIDARRNPENISNTNWRSQVNAYMKRRGYTDPRADYLIDARSNYYYELWECNGGFDFMSFERSIFGGNGGAKYGHNCLLSIVLDNICYEVLIFM